jgi:hypothetical protein
MGLSGLSFAIRRRRLSGNFCYQAITLKTTERIWVEPSCSVPPFLQIRLPNPCDIR